jgi:RNA polymerase sigma factor (sigma-70 family)
MRHPSLPDEAQATTGVDEASLVARAQEDRRAFAPLYVRYADPIYRYCFHRLGTRQAAEDATSLVFEKAIAKLPSFKTRSFRSWLFSIAHNVIVDNYRSARVIEPEEQALGIIDPSPGPEERALAMDETRRLQLALAELPDDQRRVIELRLAGLTDHEIAEVLDRKYATVRTIQRRAVIRLQEILQIAAEPAEEARNANV